MKGIAHFCTGIAVATCFPAVVRYAQDGVLLPLAAGIAALLPDILDFKFARYWERFDVEIDPGPHPDPEAIAEALSSAMRSAYEGGRPRSVICHSVQLGLDRWQPYTVRFVPEADEIVVTVGSEVGVGQRSGVGRIGGAEHEARCRAGVPFADAYDGIYEVSTFYGPSFRFVRQGDHVDVSFLDWHHRWTHSLLLALLLGLAVAAVSSAFGGGVLARWVGLLAALGYAAHILEDQLGHMGSNLAWPLTKRRMPGLRLLHASDAMPNFLAVWTACAIALLNLDRASGSPRFPVAPYLLLSLALPWAMAFGARALGAAKLRWSAPRSQTPEVQAPVTLRGDDDA